MFENNRINRLMTLVNQGPKSPPSRPNRAPVRLQIEELEDRNVPAVNLQSVGDLVDQSGGTLPLIPNVNILPIYLRDSITSATQSHTNFDGYLSELVSSDYITSLLGQYATAATPVVGNGTVGTNDLNVSFTPNRTVDGYNAITDGQIRGIIQAEIGAGRTAASDGRNNLYVVFVPPGDVSEKGASDNSINNYGGYHYTFTDAMTGKQDFYAVIAYRAAPNLNDRGEGLDRIQSEEEVISHEVSEAITDPTPELEWDYANLGGEGEVGDLADGDSYTMNGYQVQYEWSQFAPARSVNYVLGTGANDLALSQLTPPTVAGWSGGAVATFDTTNLSLTAASFTSYVDFDDGHGRQLATITGGNGQFVISASPATGQLGAGEHGTAFTHTGMHVYVYDTAAGPIGSGIPTSIRYQPYTVAPASFAIGSAVGGSISVIQNSQSVLHTTPYPGFQGGFAVAMGDLTGDGVSDLVTVVASGGPALVTVYDGTTFAYRYSFLAFSSSYTGGASITVADLYDTGRDDIIIGQSSGGSAVAVFDGVTGHLLTAFFAYPGYPVGVTVAAGDLYGIGIAQIVTTPTTAVPLVEVFSRTGALVREFMAFNPMPGATGVTVAVGDLNENEKADILVGASIGGADAVLVFDGSGARQATLTMPAQQAPLSRQLPGPRLTVADINDDGAADLVFTAGVVLGAFDWPNLALLGSTILTSNPLGFYIG